MAEFRLSNFTDGTVLTAAELNTGLTYASYTPTWTQDVAITKTVNFARYTVFGKFVSGSIKMTATSAGTASNIVKVGLPVNASSNNFIVGHAGIVDESQVPDQFTRMFALYDSSSTMSFFSINITVGNSDAAKRFGEGPGAGDFTIASGDIIYVHFQYEAA